MFSIASVPPSLYNSVPISLTRCFFVSKSEDFGFCKQYVNKSINSSSKYASNHYFYVFLVFYYSLDRQLSNIVNDPSTNLIDTVIYIVMMTLFKVPYLTFTLCLSKSKIVLTAYFNLKRKA